MTKVGGVETWFRGETDCECCRGEGALVAEKGENGVGGWTERERREHMGTQKENTSPKPLTGKMRGADFCEVF